jgi:hypothetical protein
MEKATRISQLKEFDAFISELRFAEYLSSCGGSAALILEDKSGNKSPDFRFQLEGQSFVVEVTSLTEDAIVSTIADVIDRLLEVMPYLRAVVTAERKDELSLPKMEKKDRHMQNLLVLRSLGEFIVQLCRYPFKLPEEIDTEGMVFHLEPSGTPKSYFVISGSVIEVPTEEINKRIAEDLSLKAAKRNSFGPDFMSPKYIVAYDCGEPLVDSTDLDDLLYGDRESFGGANGKYREQVLDKWREACESMEKTPEWSRIRQSSERGWTDFLKSNRLIPTDFTYVSRPGLFLRDPHMDGVTAIALRTRPGGIHFYPNPFSTPDMNLSGNIPGFMDLAR